MYGNAPFGSVAYGAVSAAADEPSFPEPTGGGASRLLLMGIRSLAFLALLFQ